MFIEIVPPARPRIRRVPTTVDQNAFQAVINGRLIPARRPLFLALGLSHIPPRRFLAVTGTPVWDLALAIVAAVTVSGA